MSAGHEATGPMERLTRLLFVLGRSGGPVSATELLRVLGYGSAEAGGRRRQLARDVEQLRHAGWDIRNEAPAGEDAQFRLVAGDLRVRVELEADEQAELQRVARVARLALSDPEQGREHRHPGDAADGADRGDLQAVTGGDAVHDFVPAVDAEVGPLDSVLHALRHRCLLRFTYRETRRTVHPRSLHPRSTGWYLRATEATRATRATRGTVRAAGDAKLFRLDRMSDVVLDPPGSSSPAPDAREERVSIDPITWHRDPPLVAQVATTDEHRQHVVDLLGAATTAYPALDGQVVLDIPVTNRAAFRARLYELGVRVELLGPQQLRDEVRAELTAVLEGAS